MKKKILSILLLGISVVSIQSCKRKFDVNQNPNVAQNTTPALLLPASQLALGSAMGVDFQINGSIWAQYWTQYYNASQYRRLEQYQPDGAQYDRVWRLYYSSALMDMKQMEKLATAQNLKQYQAISLLLQAYTFQVATDAWGDVPFSEALKGLPEDGGILSPKYDAQESIYDGLIKMVDNGMALIDPSDVNHPGSDDLIYGGDMEQWAKFGNTLKLKILLRQSEVAPSKAQQGITALYVSNPDFIGEGDDAKIDYLNTSGNQNPLYTEIVGLGKVQNIIASATSVDSMLANDDERVLAFYESPIGIKQGFYNAPSGTPFSPPSAITGANANDAGSALAPVKFITSYESYFLQAEAAARGWGTGDGKALFEQGIYASFNSVSSVLDGLGIVLRDSLPNQGRAIFPLTADYSAYAYINGDTLTGFIEGDPVASNPASYWGIYPASGTVQQKVRHIITQKWFSMNGTQGFEAWTEWRRTDYPDFFVVSENSRIGNKFPARFFYPSDELNTNAKFPGQKLLTDRVWWDVR